jgi:hypothetical protein
MATTCGKSSGSQLMSAEWQPFPEGYWQRAGIEPVSLCGICAGIDGVHEAA